MNKKMERQEKLLQIIKTQGMLSVKSLASMLTVSEMTVRRDLKDLHCENGSTDSIQRDCADGNYSLLAAAQKAYRQKERIGQFAASLIASGDVIIIDTGSTTARMLPHIPSNHNLTVVCYNANVMLELRGRQGIQLFMCGGVYHENTEMFESVESIQFIKRIRANKVFLSAAGVHEQLGITCANNYEVPTKNAIIKSASEKILMADSSKFGQIRSSYFCELSDINTIITDTDLSADWRERILSKGIVLHLV